MRDCKGIKILLGIGPSSHSSEDLLPKPEVFSNLRLSPMSFLLSLCRQNPRHANPKGPSSGSSP